MSEPKSRLAREEQGTAGAVGLYVFYCQRGGKYIKLRDLSQPARRASGGTLLHFYDIRRLLVPQRLDRVEGRRALGGPDAEAQTHRGGEEKRHDDRAGIDGGVHSKRHAK